MIIYNRRTYGLFENGCFQLGYVKNFSVFTTYTAESYSGNACAGVLSNVYGATALGDEYVEIDTSKTYQLGVAVKTIQLNYLGHPGSGHLGFACYDSKKRFIDRRNCGGRGNTYLSRDANPGDSFIYVQSSSDWIVGDVATVTAQKYYFRHVIFFPATHPEYNIPHYYTRIGFGDFNIYYKSMTQTTNGDWQLELCDYQNNSITLPDIGYPLPAGTPVSRGVAGGTYNYVLGNPDYPEEWTFFISGAITGEHGYLDNKFKYATKYIRFLNLRNYNYRTETAGDSARYLLDNILLLECPDGKLYDKSVFMRRDVF